MLVEFDFN